MGDQWEARIGVIENIQEEFGHDIQEIKERLARLTSLLEYHIRTEVVHPRSPSPLPNRQVPRPFVQTTSYLPRRTDRPNLQQPRQQLHLMDKRLKRTNHDGTPFPSLTPNYSQSWYEVVTLSHFSLHLSDPHFQDGTMPTLDATATAGI